MSKTVPRPPDDLFRWAASGLGLIIGSRLIGMAISGTREFSAGGTSARTLGTAQPRSELHRKSVRDQDAEGSPTRVGFLKARTEITAATKTLRIPKGHDRPRLQRSQLGVRST